MQNLVRLPFLPLPESQKGEAVIPEEQELGPFTPHQITSLSRSLMF